jgi:hypothetical protein
MEASIGTTAMVAQILVFIERSMCVFYFRHFLLFMASWLGKTILSSVLLVLLQRILLLSLIVELLIRA